MGRRIQGQRRGHDTSTFQTPSHHYKAELLHKKSEGRDTISGVVTGVEYDPTRSAPITLVEFEDEQRIILAPEGISIDGEFQTGVSAEIGPGDMLSLAEIPEDVPACSVEHQPGDDGKFIRASSASAQLLSHDRKVAIVKLSSGEVRCLNSNCRAIIGVVTGGGCTGKPSVKAGKEYHKAKAHGIKWLRVRGVAMNAANHPFDDGDRQHPGQPKSASRGAPSGRKVGGITSKRTGHGGKKGK